MATVRIVPEVAENGEIFLTIFQGAAVDRVGPLQRDEELLAVLDEPVVSKGPSPPSLQMKKLSQKQERRIAKDLGGHTQPGSGSKAKAKGDVRVLGKHRVEAKYTFAKSYVVHLADLRKILSEVGEGEKAAFQVDFMNRDTQRVTDCWVLIPYEDWLENSNAPRRV